MRIYFLDRLDHIRRGEWLDCDVGEIGQVAADRLGDYFAVEVWRRSEKLMRIERPPAAAAFRGQAA